MWKRPPPDYLKWLNASSSHDDETTMISAETDLDQLKRTLPDSKGMRINIEDNVVMNPNSSPLICYLFDNTNRKKVELATLDIPIVRQHPVTISNSNINRLSIKANSGSKLHLKNCWVGELRIGPSQQRHGPFVSMSLTSTWVGRLVIIPNSIRDMKFHRGGVLSVSCPPTFEGNPVSGAAEMRAAFLPRRDGMFRGETYGSQPWTNMRSHLLSSGNPEAASLFHASALSIERRSYPWHRADRWIGALYEYAGEYGNSISRPLWFLLASWLVFAAAYYIGDAAAYNSDWGTHNWRSTLEENNLMRCAYLSASAIINPLGLTAGVQPTEPSTIGWYSILTFQRISSLILLFLLGIAIRRKFRMSSA